MYGNYLDSLSPKEKEAMAWYVAHIILADGKVVHSELEFIKQILAKIKLEDSQTALDIFERVKNKQKLGALPNLAQSDHSTVMKMFLILLHVAVSDFNFDEQEEIVLLIIGSTIGFSEKTIEDLIGHHKAILKIANTDYKSRSPCVKI
ncbi:MAG: TerB family tellurite resistance protein [Deltaproteobacteria bacterium]|nr:TerB family tellurite resistance protein [Deltaproteobacteria bacterium]